MALLGKVIEGALRLDSSLMANSCLSRLPALLLSRRQPSSSDPAHLAGRKPGRVRLGGCPRGALLTPSLRLGTAPYGILARFRSRIATLTLESLPARHFAS